MEYDLNVNLPTDDGFIQKLRFADFYFCKKSDNRIFNLNRI